MSNFIERLLHSRGPDVYAEKRNDFLQMLHSERWVSRLDVRGQKELQRQYEKHFVNHSDSAVVDESFVVPNKDKRYATRDRQQKAERMIEKLIQQSEGVLTREDFDWDIGAVFLCPGILSQRGSGVFRAGDMMFDPNGVTIFVKVKK